MSDASSSQISRARRDWVAEHLDLYLRSGGAQGHIVDVSEIGGHRFTTTLLLRVAGRRTGEARIVPLIYGDFGGEIVVVASKGGADRHPAWYLNIRNGAQVDFQVATQAFRGKWREPQGAERTRVWEYMVGVYPPYAQYQASTDRQIPLVMFSADERIENFSA
jgi:deazaflavin-dependent oxidoreductase (nitroreductase family)